MYVKQISDVKEDLEILRANGLVKEWALPYENLLTRLSAAIFFITPVGSREGAASGIWRELDKYDDFSYRLNHEKKLSVLEYRVTFSKEEKEKNLKTDPEVVNVR